MIEIGKKQMINDLVENEVQQRDAEIRANKYFGTKFGRTLSNYISLGKYQSPPRIPRDPSTLKVLILQLGDIIGISRKGNELKLEQESGYCKEVSFHFGRIHLKQIIETTYRHYEDPKDDDHLIQAYEKLTKQAIKDHPLKDKGRFMKSKIYSCKLLPNDTWEDISLWKAEASEGEEEIYCIIEATVGDKIDKLLSMERKWMEIDSAERMEEVIERASVQYVEANLNHKLPATSEPEPEEDKPDLTPLEFIKSQTKIPIEESNADQKKAGFKLLAKAYISQRVLLMREYKRKIAHALNYFCSVKKKLIQDAIELGTRHTMTEANIQIKTMNPIAQKRQLKRTQNTDTKLSSAPPSIFHADSGHPITFKSNTEAFNEEIAKRKAAPLFKMEYIAEDEVRLIDSNGVYVILSSALTELENTITRLMICGTYYITQYEDRYGLFCKNKKPSLDRATVLLDLLAEECKFQYEKLEVVSKLMYVYDHTTDYAEMQAVGQEIYNFIARRPRLQLVSEYFIGSYQMEIQCMRSYENMLRIIIDKQIKEESKIDETNCRNILKRFEQYRVNSSLSSDNIEEVLGLDPKRKDDLLFTVKSVGANEVNDMKELYEFIAFKEGWHYALDEPLFEYPNDQLLPKYKLGTIYTSLPHTAYIISTIQNALQHMIKYYHPESGFAIAALECELVMQAETEYETITNFTLNPPKAISNEMNSIEINSFIDFSFDLIDTIKGQVTKDINYVEMLCNLVEVIKLREYLIEALYETHILTETYTQQQKITSHHSPITMSEPIIIHKDIDLNEESTLNFAIKEFDPHLQSLLKFNSRESIKGLVLKLGLEELRGVLHYQKMQVQALQVVVQTNHWMYLPYTRAFAELDSAMGNFVASSNKKRRSFTIPNSVLPLKVGEDIKIYSNEEEKVRKKFVKSIAGCFVEIVPVKISYCDFVRKGYKEYEEHIKNNSNISIDKSLKSYSIYLLHQYCDQVLNHLYSLATYTQLFVIADSLRRLHRLFPDSAKPFDCQKSFGLEFTPFSSDLSLKLDRFQTSEVKYNFEASVLKVPSTEDIAIMVKAAQVISKANLQLTFELNDPESFIGQYLEKRKNIQVKDSSVFTLANGLYLMHRIVTLELLTELPHVPLRLWVKMIKKEKVNILFWRSAAKENTVLEIKESNDSNLETAIREKVEEEYNLHSVEYILKNVANRIKTMDTTLYKTFKYNSNSAIKYIKVYCKTLIKLLDDFPTNTSIDNCFESLIRALNHIGNMNLGSNSYVSNDLSCFRFFPLTRLDQINTDSDYFSKYQTNVLPENFNDPDIIRNIKTDLPKQWPFIRLKTMTGITENEILGLFYSLLMNKEIRSNFLNHYTFISKNDNYDIIEEPDDISELKLLPVNILKIEELEEEYKVMKEAIRLRRLNLALMAWLTNTPSVQNLSVMKDQRQMLKARTCISMMTIDKNKELQKEKFKLTNNQVALNKNLSKVHLIQSILKKELIAKGINTLKEVQAVVADLLDKRPGTPGYSIDSLRGTAATIYSNVDIDQKKCISNSVSYIQTFLTQIKNRATLAESLTTGATLIITLHDFNTCLQTLCRNVWRMQIAKNQAQVFAERKIQEELQAKYLLRKENLEALKNKVQQNKKAIENTINIEVGQRCYEQIYEVERAIRQCQYWKERLNKLEEEIRGELREEVKKELADKELQLKGYETQFADYKATLMAQLKAEIINSNAALSKKKHSMDKGEVTEEDLDIEYEAEAYDELAKLQEKIHKLRIFYYMRLRLQKEKYNDHIALIKKQITPTKELQAQLNAVNDREYILKQELINTEENMNGFENALKQIKDTLKEKDETLLKFGQAKNTKSTRMCELEAKLKKLSVVEIIDVNQIHKELEKKNKELNELRNTTSNNKEHLESIKNAFQSQLKWMKKKVNHEEQEKAAAIKRAEELQFLLEQAKANESTKKEKGGLWYDKCKELLEVCKALKNENEMFRLMIKEKKQAVPDESLRIVDSAYLQETTTATRRHPGVTNQSKKSNASGHIPFHSQARSSSHGNHQIGEGSHIQRNSFFVIKKSKVNIGLPKSKNPLSSSMYPS